MPGVVAYLVSRFPVVTETFILREMRELERRGTRVEIFSLVRQREEVVHSEAAPLVDRAHYGHLFSLPLLLAHLRFLFRHPRRYIGMWGAALRGNVSSAEFLSRALYVLWQAPAFAQAMERAGVEHIHAHWATHPALAAFAVARLTGIPYSFTAHAHDLYVGRSMLEEKLDEAQFVVTISDYNRRLIAKLYGDEVKAKTVVVHCGIDPGDFRPARNEAPHEGPLRLLCVASLRDYKGHPFLLDACARLQDRGVPFACRLVGEGEERPSLERLIRTLHLEGTVELLGAQPETRVRELLMRSDVMVLPSVVTSYGKMEGIPVALMEALAVARPVVATRISGVPELVEDGVTGLLVPERDGEALATALQSLADDPQLRRRLGEAGRSKVVREFNLARSVTTLDLLFAHDWSIGPPALPSVATHPVEDEVGRQRRRIRAEHPALLRTPIRSG